MTPSSAAITNDQAPLIASLGIRRRRRYDYGMTKVAKLTISLPAEQAEQVRAAVARGEAASVSSYISTALATVMPASPSEDDDPLVELLAEMDAEYGPPSPEAYAWADEVMRAALRDGSSK